MTMRVGEFWRWIGYASRGDEYRFALVDGNGFEGRMTRLHDGRAGVMTDDGAAVVVTLRGGDVVAVASSGRVLGAVESVSTI